MKKEEDEVANLCLTLGDPMDCSLPCSSIHGIFQARILEWVAISFSRGSLWPRNWTQVSCIRGRPITVWATRESSFLCNETAIQIQNPLGRWAHPAIGSLTHPPRSLHAQGSSRFHSTYLFRLLSFYHFYSLYNNPVDTGSVSLSSVSCSSRLPNLRRGLWEPPNFIASWMARSTGLPGLVTGVWSGGILWGWALSLWSPPQIRQELN